MARRRWLLASIAPLLVAGFDPSGELPFGPMKWLVATTLAFAALAVVSIAGWRTERATTVVWVALLACVVVSALFAIDPVNAWLGTPERHLGAIAWLIFAAFFFVGVSSTDYLRSVRRSFVVALAFVDGYSIVEALGHPPVGVAIGHRLGGPFGSAAYLGAACVLLVPVAIGIAGERSEPRRWRVGAGVATLAGAVPVVGSETRSAWLGLVAAALFVVVARRQLRRVFALVIVVAVVVMLVPIVHERLATGGGSRTDEWRIGGHAVVDRPLVGEGPEGYRIVFPRVVDDSYVVRYGRDVVTDRAHNGFLDVGISLGLAGLTAYGALVVLVLRRAWRGRHDVVTLSLGAALVGYLVNQQFLFPIAEVDPLFWLLAGLVVGSTSHTLRRRASRVLAATSAMVATLALGAGLLDVRADRDARTALRLATSDPVAALRVADDARALRPDSMRYDLVAATVAARPGTLPAIDNALSRMADALDLSSRDPLLRERKATLLSDRANLSGTAADLQAARGYWRSLAEADPRNPSIWLGLAASEDALGNATAAEQARRRAHELSGNP